MKKKFFNLIFNLQLLGIAAVIVLLPACKKQQSSPGPVITAIRNYAASPNDTLVTSIVPGQWIVIHGQNLKNATQILFDGVSATFNYGLFSDETAVVQIPGSIPFNSVPDSLFNTIQYTTTTGSVTYKFSFNIPGPNITGISNETFFPGDSIYVNGSDFFLVQSVNFAGAAITDYKVDPNGNYIAFVCPPQSQVPGGPITVITKYGKATTTKNYAVGQPTIIRISNENPAVGDSVYIYGTAYKNVQTVSFAGVTITNYNVSADLSTISFLCPTLSGSGQVVVTTLYGTASTSFKVNDVTDGIIATFEGGSGWEWWGGSSLYSGDPNSGWPPYTPDFPGNPTHFQALKTGILSSGEGNTYSNYAVRMSSAQWIPAANLSDPVANWTVKFEMSVPQSWNGGTIDIISPNSSYVARYEPWQVTSTTTAPFTTKGWITVTIPCSSFRATDATLGEGEGTPVSSFTTLLGNTGSSEMFLYIHNYSSSSTATGFYGAFDNFRVVKIK
jgi:hypothetical protein